MCRSAEQLIHGHELVLFFMPVPPPPIMKHEATLIKLVINACLKLLVV